MCSRAYATRNALSQRAMKDGDHGELPTPNYQFPIPNSHGTSIGRWRLGVVRRRELGIGSSRLGEANEQAERHEHPARLPGQVRAFVQEQRSETEHDGRGHEEPAI